jgi:hypothetical protein
MRTTRRTFVRASLATAAALLPIPPHAQPALPARRRTLDRLALLIAALCRLCRSWVSAMCSFLGVEHGDAAEGRCYRHLVL